MKRLFLLFFLCDSLFVVAQSAPEKISKIAFSQTARISVDFIDENGKKLPPEFGKGIVINGKYFLTCYHLIVPQVANAKLDKIYLIYNEREAKGKIVADSMILRKDFIPSKEQYDFRKHVYIPHDYETDVLVLELQKPLKKTNHHFASGYPSGFDTLYCLGNVEKDNIMYQAFESVRYLFKYTPRPLNPFFLTYFNDYTHGFSGTPLYNTHGEIQGIVQYSLETVTENDLLNWQLSGSITVQMSNAIKSEYANKGRKLQCAIDINYLKRKYLKGYL